MPELPEVETTRRLLAPQLCGRTVCSVLLSDDSAVASPTPRQFEEHLRGKTFSGVGRRGKYLLLNFADGATLIVHLRMSGALLAAPSGWPQLAHTRAAATLDDGSQLRFVDQRRFGRLWLQLPGQGEVCAGLGQLGPEPFDAAFGAAALQKACGNSGRTVKSCLLDQRVLAGVGNIYADEILFSAAVLPHRRAQTLSSEEWQRLARVIPERLEYYTEKNSVAAADFLTGSGREYRNTPFLLVYGRAGAACRRCGGILLSERLCGRTTVFCPACQH